MATDMWSDDGFVKAGMTMNSGAVYGRSIDQGLTATGSNIATALTLVSQINIIASAASGTGVRLPAINIPGAEIRVINKGSNAVAAFPPTGGVINTGTASAAGTAIAAVGTTGVPGASTFTCTGSLTFAQP